MTMSQSYQTLCLEVSDHEALKYVKSVSPVTSQVALPAEEAFRDGRTRRSEPLLLSKRVNYFYLQFSLHLTELKVQLVVSFVLILLFRRLKCSDRSQVEN